MKKWILIFLSLALLLCACAAPPDNAPESAAPPSQEQPEPPPIQTPEPTPEPPPEPPVPEPDPRKETVDALLASMTLEEKVGQLFFVRCPDSGETEKFARYRPGGCLLFTRDFKSAAGEWLTEEEFLQKIAAYQAACSIPMLIGVDEEGGSVARASRNPNLFSEKRKSPQTVYAAGGMDALRQDTFIVNSRLLELGITVNFAPVADVSVKAGDFIHDRAFGQDADATARYIAAAVEEMSRCGIGSVLKHFPGYGNNVDTHTGIALDARPYESFVSSDFLPFSAGIEAGAGAVLMSHNVVLCMDPLHPASLSREVVRILREELGFEGVILTDDLAMDAVKSYAENGEAAVLALQAGVSMIVTTDFERQIGEVLAALETGALTEGQIDEAARYILNWKYDLGLLGEPS